MRRLILSLTVAALLLCLAAVLAYNLPPLHDRLAWRVDALLARVKYALNPPEQVVFVPQQQADPAAVEQIVQATLDAIRPSTMPSPTTQVVPTLAPTLPGSTPLPSATPLPVLVPTATPEPLPGKTLLTGIVHEYQLWNNCGPANLAMDLSFWGWPGDQKQTAAFLKPNQRDKNVMPDEMAAFVTGETDYKVMLRVGGDLPLLKTFVAAGFPVIVEKGFEGVSFDGWMGHYEVVNGDDDSLQHFTVQDSYNGPNEPVAYDEMESQWRAFNHTYLVTYPPEREAEVLAILGPQADESENFQYAARQATAETQSLTRRDQYFAWYNLGTNLVSLKDYANAAAAYDTAFSLYPSIPKKQRPWRMLCVRPALIWLTITRSATRM